MILIFVQDLLTNRERDVERGRERDVRGKAETKTKTTGMPLKAINCKLKRMPETASEKGGRGREAIWL